MNNDVFYYQIQEGDYPYSIAQKFNVPVSQILRLNPGINPRNLTVGSYILIPRVDNDIGDYERLKESLRSIWILYAYWIELVIISIVNRSDTEEENIQRLMEMPEYTAGLLEQYFRQGVANIINSLLRNHLFILPQLVHAIIDQQSVRLNQLNSQWHSNADNLAVIFGSISPYYDEQVIKDMAYKLLDDIIAAIMFTMENNAEEEGDAFDEVKNQALVIADYLAEGIYQQFYNQNQ